MNLKNTVLGCFVSNENCRFESGKGMHSALTPATEYGYKTFNTNSTFTNELHSQSFGLDRHSSLAQRYAKLLIERDEIEILSSN